jgi:hydrogenase nickel incorporation protein HypA/HybF
LKTNILPPYGIKKRRFIKVHEYHAVESLVRQLIKEAKSSNANRVSWVRLALGELSDFTEDSIQLYFKEIAQGSILDNANVSIKRIKAKLHCKDCGASFEYRRGDFTCPECKSINLALESGKEFYIEEMGVV